MSNDRHFGSALVLPQQTAGLPHGERVAVALSGGADSVALLHALKKRGCSCHAIHVHHGIRGAEADRDAAFCERLTAEWNIPFTLLHVDVPAMARQRRQSIETAARELRYEVIEACMQRLKIQLLVTAHHADDQLETMLQHLLRGSGLRGLCGIPVLRPLQNGVLVRPLLPFSKDDILAYCRENGLDFVTDSTNSEDCCTRNKLRLAVLPTLFEIQPAASRLAARCAASLAEDEALLQSMADDFLKEHAAGLPVAALANLPTPIFTRVMAAWLPFAPETVHLNDIRALCLSPAPHKSLSLPCGTVVAVRGDRLCLEAAPAEIRPFLLPLSIGVTQQQEPRIYISLQSQDEMQVLPPDNYRYTAVLRIPASSVCGGLYARPRKAGDKILHGGMHKAVRRLPSLSSLSPSVRARMPLICDDEGVLAVPFSVVRDGKNKNENTLICTVCFD